MQHTQSQRQQRVGALIQAILVETLRKPYILKNYTGVCPITITKVKVSPDLKIADSYFLPFNTALSIKQLQKLLNDSKGVIRKTVTDQVKLKYSPVIRFHHDDGFNNANKVEEILRQLSSTKD